MDTFEIRSALEIAQQDHLPDLTKTAFDPDRSDSWDKVDPEELLFHIFDAHCNSYSIALFGVPNFDIELASIRGISLQPLVEKLYLALAEPTDKDIFNNFKLPFLGTNTESYQTELVKTLQFIDQLQPNTVDWEKVRQIKPDLDSIHFDYKNDCRDVSFKEQLETRQQLAEALVNAISAFFQST
ncbi:hypothetical protein IT411_02370 [Candidatus Peregrinibacteria bacterium]|nr:hypothetical protein [Candidatus Peregrinibacteria bacterium]